MNSILTIDLHSVMHHVKHGVGKTTRLSHKEVPTFVIYGFLYKLRNILKTVNHNIVVFACDSNKSKRKALFSGYKKRDESKKTQQQLDLDEAAFPQFEIIKNHVLPTIGYKNVFEFDGLEGDDIIAQIALKDYPMDTNIFSTTDVDMYQCLNDRNWMFKHDKMRLYGINDFRSDYGIEPPMWKRVKAYGGCTSDTVPGLRVFKDGVVSKRGIGQDTALNYIKGTLNPKSNTFKAFSDSRNNAQLEMNKKLVILPFKGTPSIKIVPNQLSVKGMQEIVKQYAFRNIYLDFESFRHVMRLK